MPFAEEAINSVVCWHCNGFGYRIASYVQDGPHAKISTEPCRPCGGTGRVPTEDREA